MFLSVKGKNCPRKCLTGPFLIGRGWLPNVQKMKKARAKRAKLLLLVFNLERARGHHCLGCMIKLPIIFLLNGNLVGICHFEWQSFPLFLPLILKWESLCWFLSPVSCIELQEWLVGIHSAYSAVLSPTYHHSASQSWCADDQWRACRVRGKSFPVSVLKNFQFNRTHRKERSHSINRLLFAARQH